MPSAAEYKNFIVTEVGDVGGVVATNVNMIWAMYDRKARADPTLHLQYLYAKLKAIDVLMGSVRQNVTMTLPGGKKVDQTDLIRNLELIRKATEAERNQYEGQLLGGLAPAVGTLTATTLRPSPTGSIDANDGIYQGDPNRRPPGW